MVDLSDSNMKVIDFQGFVSLDQPLVDQLALYLQEKESQLCSSIIHAIHPLPREFLPPILPHNTSGQIKLHDAIDSFRQNIDKIENSSRPLVASDDWRLAKRQLNNALWEYLEILDGSMTELFQLLSQIGFEQWHPDLFRVVESIKEMLGSRMEALAWHIQRLDSLLWKYRWICESKAGKSVFLFKILSTWSTSLDRSFYSYIRKSKKCLDNQFKKFTDRYERYHQLRARIDRSVNKFESYHVFKKLDDEVQRNFKKIYELLKLWVLNQRSKSLPEREPIHALRTAFSMERATELFRLYKIELKKALFQRSRKFKEEPNDLYYDESSRRVILEVLKSFRNEVHTLGATIERYRNFFLTTHPNPYVRTRWGFTEWVVGPEPAQTKDLLNLVYEVELLDKLFANLSESLAKGPSPTESMNLARSYREIQQTLHDMGQPLTSRTMLLARAERLLDQIAEMNELGSFQPEVVDYVGKSFSKGLRADWQYHVLFDIPRFHQLYTIHQGVLGPIEDLHHIKRMKKFAELIAQVQGWVQNRDTHRHVIEIETDMTDMKNYLQDVFAYVQRVAKDDGMDKPTAKRQVGEIAKQLLEYRYLFGNFFHTLHQYDDEGKMIRNQFLFVDQYFESIENKLHDMRQRWK